jgi:hypothetical protein
MGRNARLAFSLPQFSNFPQQRVESVFRNVASESVFERANLNKRLGIGVVVALPNLLQGEGFSQAHR